MEGGYNQNRTGDCTACKENARIMVRLWEMKAALYEKARREEMLKNVNCF